MREKTIEQYLCDAAIQRGGRAYKWTSPGRAGVPDRLVILPGPRVLGVECKAPGKQPTVLQARLLAELRGLGIEAAAVDSFDAIDQLLGATP